MASNDRPDFELSAPSASATVGEQLRAARVQAGMSIDTVAKQLKLAPRQVGALEADDVAQLPAGPFLRGFIRNYARLVNLDPEQLLGHDITRRTAVSPLDAAPPNRGELREGGVRPEGNILRWVIPLGLVAALLVGATWYEMRRTRSQSMGETVVTLPSNPTPTPSANAPSPTPAPTTVAAPIAPRPAETPQEAPTVPTAQLVAPAATPTEVASPALPNPTLPAPVTSVVSSATAPTPATPSTPKAVALELTFDEQAWTEIRDSERNVLTSKTHAKGTKLTVSGQPPFRFTIGNARNVTLTRDGTPVDLGTRIGAGDVAKFTLE